MLIQRTVTLLSPINLLNWRRYLSWALSRDPSTAPARVTCAAALLVATQLVALLGCSRESGSTNTSQLKGKITLNGQAIAPDASASITFKPTRKGQAKTAFASLVDGAYDSPLTPRGPVKVYLSIQQPTGKMVSEAGGAPYAEVRSLVPPSYTRGIDLEVGSDKFDQDFDLR